MEQRQDACMLIFSHFMCAHSQVIGKVEAFALYYTYIHVN